MVEASTTMRFCQTLKILRSHHLYLTSSVYRLFSVQNSFFLIFFSFSPCLVFLPLLRLDVAQTGLRKLKKGKKKKRYELGSWSDGRNEGLEDERREKYVEVKG